MSEFKKPSLNLSELLTRLKDRGLIVRDDASVLHYLEYIGYYRLSAYMRPFQQGEEHTFKPGTTFEMVLERYVFDRKLRLHLLDAIERIEIALRSIFHETLSNASPYKGLWYLDSEILSTPSKHSEWVTLFREKMGYHRNPRDREKFIEYYLSQFTEPADPPGYMMVQTLTMGNVSQLYKAIKLVYQKEIARKLGVNDQILGPGLHSLTYVRNLCAHHARVWNRQLAIRPIAPSSQQKPFKGAPDRIGAVVVLIERILSKISPASTWRRELDELISEYNIPSKSMGLD